MDDALRRVYSMAFTGLFPEVLILVLMDDALRQYEVSLKFTKANRLNPCFNG